MIRTWPFLAATAAAVAVTAAGCASALSRMPAGPWVPEPDAAPAFTAATAACRGARTLSAEIAVSGRAGASKLRGRLLAGLERPGQVRLEAVAPFGAPLFILTARADRGALYLPRDHRILTGTPVADILEALTGVRRSADGLAALVSGCLVADPAPGPALSNQSGWMTVELRDGLTAVLRRVAGSWRVVRGLQAAGGASTSRWTVEYPEFAGAFPSVIRLREGDLDAGGRATTDLTLRVSQLDVNVAIDPAAFDARAPGDVVPMSLSELRRLGPLADRGAAGVPPGDGRRP